MKTYFDAKIMPSFHTFRYTQARNQLRTTSWAKSFLRGAQKV